jgi:hypothetical protein
MVEVRHRVRADGVALGGDAARDLGKTLGLGPDEEERGDGLVATEEVEDRGRAAAGSIVVGQVYGASPGRPARDYVAQAACD